MRVSVIFGPGTSERDLRSFQAALGISWQFGVPNGTGDADVLFVVGGDGTMHRNLPRLLELQIPVLIVPRGSGNDFARGLGLGSLRDALNAWRNLIAGKHNIRAVDIGLIKALDTQQQHYFCTIAGVGLDGEVARRANRLPRWLRANGGYALTLVPSLFRFAPFPMRITTQNDSSLSSNNGFHPTMVAAFANAPAYGGGMKIAPLARMDDGELDLCIIRDIDKFKLFCLFPTVYFGKHLGISEVKYFQASYARLETEYPLDVYADGEYVCRTPIEVSLRRGGLPVVVPQFTS
jgi:diacylglycerol kinase (ATP)